MEKSKPKTNARKCHDESAAFVSLSAGTLASARGIDVCPFKRRITERSKQMAALRLIVDEKGNRGTGKRRISIPPDINPPFALAPEDKHRRNQAALIATRKTDTGHH
jgi:hypothetical protein